MNKNILVIIYLIGSILITMPSLFLLKFENIVIKEVNKALFFNFDLRSIIITIFSITIIILLDIIYFLNFKYKNRNNTLINKLFEKRNFVLDPVFSFLTGYFEEIFFRGYLYLLLLITISNIININEITISLIVMIFISIIFGLFHLTQGLIAFFLSLVMSMIFFLTIKISGTIWYAIIGHALFNYIEITFVLPWQKSYIQKDN